MLDLEYATDAVSNADLDEAMVGAPVAAPPAVERRTSVVAGHRLMVPGPSYAAMEEAYKDMYAEYYYPDGTLRPDAYDRWGYDSGSYEAYRGDDRDPTVVLPADDKNGSAVVLTAFSNDPAEAGATAPRRAVSFAAAVGDGRRNGAGGSGADAPAATKPKRAMGPRKGSDPTPSPTTKVEGSPHSPSSPGKRRSGAADAPSSASSIGAPAAVPLGMSEGEVIRGSSDVPPEWVEEQKRLAAHAILDDSDVGFVLPWDEKPMVEAPSLPGLEHCPPSVIVTPDGRPPAALRVVGGLDISFLKDTNIAVASLVIMEYPSLRVLHTEMLHTEMNVPYVAGFLAFREVKPLQDVIAAAKLHYPSGVPQLYLVDGNGALHFRKCGLATHLGVLIGAPTIGVAKKLLNVDGLANDDSAVERIKAKAAASGKSTAWDAKVAPLIGRSGQTWGYGALTGNSTAKPVFISAGHRLSHLTAARLALSMAPYRVIEPIRQADLGSRAYIKKHFEDKASDAPAAPPSSSTAAA